MSYDLLPSNSAEYSVNRGHETYFFRSRKISTIRIISHPLMKFIVLVLFIVFFGYKIISNKDTVLISVSSKLKILPNTKPVHISLAAANLPKNGSIACWVLTAPKYHETRARAINETWLSRCDHGQLFSSEPVLEETVPSISIFSGMDDNYDLLYYKTLKAFDYLYKNVSSEFDWYLKADDDTYVIVENLRSYLSTLDHTKPYYLGYTFKPFLKNGYQAGGAGYVLSNAAVKMLIQRNDSLCPFGKYEDVALANCLASLSIYPTDTRNAKGQNRFNPYSLEVIFSTTKDDVVYQMWPEPKGYDAFAEDAITFHHQTPAEIRMMDNLLYRIKLSK